jgi:hypothetical protein
MEIAEHRGRSPFEVLNSSWKGKGSVYTQLALSNDSDYLAYEEYLHPEQAREGYGFTYCWKLRDIDIVDDDYFGRCTLINRGVPFHSLHDRSATLRFCSDNTTLLHVNGKYDVVNQKPLSFLSPSIRDGDIRSVHVSPNGRATLIIRSKDDDAQSTNLEVWANAGEEALMTLNQTFRNRTPNILAASLSGRFVAFTHRISGSESESYSESDSELDTEFSSAPKSMHSVKILDTRNGCEHELYSYGDDTWNAGYDSVTPLRPEGAFFGHAEPEATLFISRMKSGLKHPEGWVWRRSLSGWMNVGHIDFDWACAPLIFSSDDSEILGIRRDGLFSARADSLEERVTAVETCAVRQETEYHRSCWKDSSLYYLNSDMLDGTTYKVSDFP